MFLYTHTHRIFISNISMFISSVNLERKHFMQTKLYTKQLAELEQIFGGVVTCYPCMTMVKANYSVCSVQKYL